MGGGIKRYGSPARIDISFECLNSADVPATPGQKRNEARPQPELPLTANRPVSQTPTKASNPAPDLRSYDPKTRDLLLKAMERDAATRPVRKTGFARWEIGRESR